MESMASPADLLLARALLAIAVILLLGRVLGWLMVRLHQPPVIGEIAAGILLGPSLLGLVPGNLPSRLFSSDIKPLLSIVGQIGLLVFMFLIGWEFDKTSLRGAGRMALSVSASSMLVSFGLGAGLATVLYQQHSQADGGTVSRTAFLLFLGTAMSITAFPVLARILVDQGLARTRLGALALVSASIDDVLAWCLLALVSAIVTAQEGADLIQVVVSSLVYLAIMVMVVRPVLVRLFNRYGTRLSWRTMPVLAAGVFVSSYATTWIGIHAIFGAFFFGLLMPRATGAERFASIKHSMESVSGLLLPVFFILTGLYVDVTGLSGRNWLELLAIITVACLGKVSGALIPARAFGLSWHESRTLGILMNTRGLTELIILNAGVELGVLDQQMFTMMVIMAMVTTAAAGPLLAGRSGGPGTTNSTKTDSQVQDPQATVGAS